MEVNGKSEATTDRLGDKRLRFAVTFLGSYNN